MTHLDHYVVLSDDQAIDLFCAALKAKAADARAKGREGWHDPDRCPAVKLQDMLLGHVFKGDPRDVGWIAAMLYARDLPTSPPDLDFRTWFYSKPHRGKYEPDHPAYLAAKEAWEAIQTGGVTS